MILTIGMIVKNEEKYLRSCLEAISPILKQIDSELIIADTGSADSTVEIAKSFTDKVFYFEWCDDFSAARNSTLNRAQGEWYMSLDADEIFDDVSGIIEFFDSGEYKNYNSATYVIRSFNSVSRLEYADYNAFRLTRIKKNTRYQNRIHESLPFYTPCKNLFDIAIHYGYLTENNDEFIEKKSQRNLDLLFSELENDPYNCKYYLEIGQTYLLTKKLESALEYFTKGLQYAKKQNHVLLNPLYGDTVHVKFGLRKFSDVLSVIEEYFKNRKRKSEIDLQMYFMEATSHYELKNYNKSIDVYKHYTQFYREYHEGSWQTKDSVHYVVKFIDNYSFRLACMNLVYACIEEKDYLSASDHLKLIPLSDWNKDERDIRRRLALEINLMEATTNYSQLPVLMQQLNENYLVLFQAMIEPMFEDESKRNQILTEITNSNLSQTDYVKLLKLRYDFFCDHSLTKQAVEAFITEVDDWSPFYADVIYLALYFELDITLLASKINAYDLNWILSGNYLHFKDMPQMICQMLGTNSKYKEDIHSQLWLASLSMWALGSDQLTPEQTVSLFNVYADATNAFMNAVYNPEFLTEENMCLLPQNLRVGYYCNLILHYWKSGKKSKYIEYLKIVLKICPEFKHIVQILLEELQKDLNSEKEKSDLSEFEQYALVVKKNIHQLIEASNLSQAAELLKSYEELCPADTEIEILKKRLETSSRG